MGVRTVLTHRGKNDSSTYRKDPKPADPTRDNSPNLKALHHQQNAQEYLITGHLFRRQEIWWPTWPGWAVLAALVVGPLLLWLFEGEHFLSQTKRLPARILVVEGWIGADAVRGAEQEFNEGGYQYVVTTSGLTGDRWDKDRASYAAIAARQLRQSGIPEDRIIVATPPDTERQRTYLSAVAVKNTLIASNLDVPSINVFTFGPHARRSRIVFSKVFGSKVKVGIISWIPAGYTDSPWWHSSDRANELVRESVGILYEVLLDSGRLLQIIPALTHHASGSAGIRLFRGEAKS